MLLRHEAIAIRPHCGIKEPWAHLFKTMNAVTVIPVAWFTILYTSIVYFNDGHAAYQFIVERESQYETQQADQAPILQRL